MRTKKLTLLALLSFFLGCASSESQTHQSLDPNQPMKHGWTVLTGPKRTIIGVSDQDSIDNGARLFQKHCTACHGKEAKGDGPLASAFGVKPANLTKMAKLAPNSMFVIQISEGKGDMPQWKSLLTSREIWDLSNYIQTLPHN